MAFASASWVVIWAVLKPGRDEAIPEKALEAVRPDHVNAAERQEQDNHIEGL